MHRPTLEVADIFRRHGPGYRARRRLPLQQLRVMRAIETCRTAALGGHVERCDHCQNQRISYNSCRNRHCPKCQNAARAKWVQQRQGELLPVEYFHVVFTIPEQLNALALQNPQTVYKILFQASARTLETIAGDPQHLGARIGFFSILHTWGQNLLHHPHIHCVATGGGLSLDGASWVSCRPGFFLSVRVLSRLFRRLFLEALQLAFSSRQLQFSGSITGLRDTFSQLVAQLGDIDWVVYAKPPFGGPRQVIDYLGRYTHRVAIDNHRIERMEEDQVLFQYKDYRCRDRYKTRHMTVTADEFIRRFLLHTLPPRFQRIRHYGLLASRNKKAHILLCRRLVQSAIEWLPSAGLIAGAIPELPVFTLCPVCRVGHMLRIEILACVRQPPITVDSS